MDQGRSTGAVMRAILIIAILAATARIASAYPQFQLSRDVTCTGCHLSPDGSGLLNENAINTAEAIAWKPGNGQFMYGMHTPSWLELGGGVRGAAGLGRSRGGGGG